VGFARRDVGQGRDVLRGGGRQRGRRHVQPARAADHGDPRRAGRWPGHRDVPADLQAGLRRLIELFAQNPALVIGTCLVLGLLVGSFLNVVIYRVPVMIDRELRLECLILAADDAGKPLTEIPESPPFNLMVPRSACPKCQRQIRASENIPVVSWLLLGRKCAGCKTPISGRYPFVEALTGILSAAVAWKLGFGWPLL